MNISLFQLVILAAGATVPAFSQAVEVKVAHHDSNPYKIGENVCIVATLKATSPKLENGGLSFTNKEGGGIPWETVTLSNLPDGSYKVCGKISTATLEGEYKLNLLNLNQTNGFVTGYRYDTDFKEVITIKVESEVKKLSEIKSLSLVR